MNGNGQHPPVLPRPTVAMTEDASGGVRWKCTRCPVAAAAASLGMAFEAWRAHEKERHG